MLRYDAAWLIEWYRDEQPVLPGVPYAHSRPALGFQKNVNGYVPSPVGTDPFVNVSIGGQ